jgi:hypothetical protein
LANHKTPPELIAAQGTLDLAPVRRVSKRACAWIGGDKPNWTYCDTSAVAGKPYCATHQAKCCQRIPGNLDQWVEAQIPKERKPKRIRIAKTALVW